MSATVVVPNKFGEVRRNTIWSKKHKERTEGRENLVGIETAMRR